VKGFLSTKNLMTIGGIAVAIFLATRVLPMFLPKSLGGDKV